jgi:TonB family protein
VGELFNAGAVAKMKPLLMLLVLTPIALAQPEEQNGASRDKAAPVIVRRIEPEYTTEARAKGIQGVVTLSADVASDGTTQNIRVVKSLDHGLDRNAIAAVKEWRFQPATRNGQPVTVPASIDVRFEIRKLSTATSEKPRPVEAQIEVDRPVTDDGWLASGDPCQSLLELLQIAPVK